MREFLIVITFLPIGILSAQTDAIIIKGNDTLKTKIELPLLLNQEINYQIMQYGVKCFIGDEKEKLGPSDIDILIFYARNVEERMVSHPNIFKEDYGNWLTKTQNVLLHQVVDGTIQLYEFHYTQNNVPLNSLTGNQTPVFTTRNSKVIIKKGDEKIAELPELGSFKKEMKFYISDCPILVEKLDSKELDRSDLIEIVNFYNRNCSPLTPTNSK